MEEYGFDPEIKKYFRKIMATFFAGFMWLLLNILAGMYFGLAYTNGKVSIATIIYYILSTIGLAFLIWYFYKLWKK